MDVHECSLGGRLRILKARNRSRDCKTEVTLACEIVRLLDGLSIQVAQHALTRAKSLLVMTQIVSGESALLTFAEEDAENATSNV